MTKFLGNVGVMCHWVLDANITSLYQQLPWIP